MSASKPDSDYGKLRHVLVRAIRELLYKKVSTFSLSRHYAQTLRRKEPSDVRIALRQLSKDQLIRLVQSVPEITKSDVDNLYEEFCYGGRPKFQLCLLLESVSPSTLARSLPSSFNKINTEITVGGDRAHVPPFKDFVCEDVGENDIPDVVEIRYKFQVRFSYIDPQTEENCDGGNVKSFV
ncbi:MAG TPA: hypothetical protein VMG09_13185 [Bacteroidota bacterium]|nr:hypothetical protein [Bacteroidota bacterium]